MKIIKIKLVIIINLLSLSYLIAGSSILPFLKIGPSARASGMGDTFVAVADDANASYWNPAGIANLKYPSITLMHMAYLVDTYYDYAAFAFPLNKKVKIGGHIVYLNYGSIERTYEDDYGFYAGSDGSFTPYDISAAFSLAYRLSKVIQIGVSTKYALESIDNVSYGGFLFDGGMMLKMRKLTLGVSIANVGLRILDEHLPRILRSGLSSQFSILKKNDLLVSLAVNYNFDQDKSVQNVGFEYWIKNMFCLRGGYKIGYDIGNFTFGAGYRIAGSKKFQLDYSFVPFSALGDTHRLSISFNFINK